MPAIVQLLENVPLDIVDVLSWRLTQLAQCRYLENVPAIVPLLEKEYRNAAARLESTQEELNDLHPDK